MSQADIIIHFPKGLIGYPEHTSFRLLEAQDGFPLKFLQSTLDPDVSFSCMDAAAIKLDYEVPLSPEEAEFLSLATPEEAMVLAILVVPPDNIREMTANLAGPVVINAKSRVGRQIALDSRVYPLAFKVFSARKDNTIQFPAGLIGFTELKRYRLFEPTDAYPLKFLQSVDQENVSFTCINVAAIKPDYSVPLNDEDAQNLAIHAAEDALVLALVAIPKDPKKMTANLAGPLVVNTKTMQGRQIVLNIEQYPLAYPVFQGE